MLSFAASSLATSDWPAEYPSHWRYCISNGENNRRKATEAAEAHKLIFAALYMSPFTLDAVCEGVKDEDASRTPFAIHVAAGKIATALVYSEYYGCMDRVAPFFLKLLLAFPYIWRSIAHNPSLYARLGAKFRDSKLYYDALRHLVAHCHDDESWHYDSAWDDVAKEMGITVEQAKDVYRPRILELDRTVHRLEHKLLQLQLTSHWTLFSGDQLRIRTTFLGSMSFKWKDRRESSKANERADYLACGLWGQWLANKLTGERLSESTKGGQPAGPFNWACAKLVEAARSEKVRRKLFDYKAPARICSIFKLGHRYAPEQRVTDMLDKIVEDAAEIIEDIFAIKEKKQADGTVLTYRRSEYDIQDRYFTYLPLPESEVPWADEMPWEEPEDLPEVDMTEASEEWLAALGIHKPEPAITPEMLPREDGDLTEMPPSEEGGSKEAELPSD